MYECADKSDLTEGFDKLIEINPLDADLWNAKGESLLHMNYLSEAMECFDRALSLDRNSSKILTNKGRVLFERGESKKATYYFNKTLSIDPMNGLAMLYKGICLYLIKDYEESIKCYNEALILEPIGEISTIWYEIGRAFSELEEYKKSVESFDKALESERLNPADPNSIGKVCSILREKARSLLFLKKIDEALECSNIIFKLDPENHDALIIRDQCLRRQSKNPSL